MSIGVFASFLAGRVASGAITQRFCSGSGLTESHFGGLRSMHCQHMAVRNHSFGGSR